MAFCDNPIRNINNIFSRLQTFLVSNERYRRKSCAVVGKSDHFMQIPFGE